MITRLFRWQHTAASRSSYVVRITNSNIYCFGDPDGARPVLRAVDWTVREGESWAVVGSGAGGKTALLEVSERDLSTRFLSPTLLDSFLVPLSMSVAYARYADPPREHADIPPSTWWTSALSIAEVSSYQRSRIPCLVCASNTCIRWCVLRLYRTVWCSA